MVEVSEMVDALSMLPQEQMRGIVEELILSSNMDNEDIKDFGEHLIEMVQDDIKEQDGDLSDEEFTTIYGEWASDNDWTECCPHEDDEDKCPCTTCKGDLPPIVQKYEELDGDHPCKEIHFNEDWDDDKPEDTVLSVNLVCEDDPDDDPCVVHLNADILHGIIEYSNQEDLSFEKAFVEMITEGIKVLDGESL